MQFWKQNFEKMKLHRPAIILIAATVAVLAGSPVSVAADLVTFEAESGTLGSDWAVSNSASPACITILSNDTGSNPGNATRVASYSVTFPSAGTYQLYARIRVGAGTYNDDSLFLGNGFGVKTPALDPDWVLANGLAGVGFTASADIVTGAGIAGSQVWKWINLSQFAGSPGLTVSAGNLTQTFQVGAREDGLELDKFLFGTATGTYTVAELDSGSNAPPVIGQRDLVAGNLIQFNDNGAWCWFQDERAVVDAAGGQIVVGSVASASGRGGSPREGDVEATLFDLKNRAARLYTLKSGDSDPGAFYADDHNAPGLLVLTNGGYLAIYAAHNTEKLSYWRIFDGTNWSPEQVYDWNTQPGGADFNTTYSNPHYMAGGRIYNFSRGNFHGSPNLITSDDNGRTWTYRGVLLTNQSVGYVNGYFNYCGNGVDRLDFVCTEYHPNDFNTSIYHGYISNGMSFRTDGTVVDTNLFDQIAPTTPDFTRVFAANTVMPAGQTNTRCWNIDLQRYHDGTIAILFKARVNDTPSDPEHAFFYARWNGNAWTTTYLGKAGKRLYVSQEDYTGLGALCPDDPNTLFISTPIDPRNQTNLTVHEIFKGVTTDHGATWSWTPITQKSVRDNLRPIVPAWDQDDRVLLWWRGTYSTAQIFDAAVVGIIDRAAEVPGTMTYVDATSANTTFSDGSALTTTGPDTNAGAADNRWHLRTGVGNGDAVLASAETGGEDAPTLRTSVTLPGAGTYDLWADFWGTPAADWRIKAGLATNRMQVLREMACRQVQAGDHRTALVLTNLAENAYLYQACVGRITVTNSTAVGVFVDDEAIATGTTSLLTGNTTRTWYDGVSYAKVDAAGPLQIKTAARPGPTAFTLTWNSRAPSSLLLPQTFSVQRKDALSDANWTSIATGISSGGSTTTFTDNSAAASAAFYRVTSP